MMTMSLSVKEEKDDKFQQTKKEVIEMIKMRIPSMMSKVRICMHFYSSWNTYNVLDLILWKDMVTRCTSLSLS